MRNALSLFRVLSKNAEMPRPKENSRSRLYTSLGIIALCCIMIPCCIIVGYISYVMAYALINVDVPMAGVQAEIHILSAFSLIFGFWVIFSILFFSSDREHLMPLPFKSEEILAAKFAHCYIAESMMEFLILISMFIGFFIAFIPACGAKIISILASIVGVILIPLLPLIYCAILCLVIMAAMRGVKNGKILNHVSTIVFLLFTGLFLLSFKDLDGITVDNYVDSLANGTNLFSNVLDKFFFTVPLLLNAIEKNSILYLLCYILANLACAVFLVFLGKFLYQPALYTVAALGSGRKAAVLEIRSKSSSPLKSYLRKEFFVLIRTKAYANNCIFVNFLWPFAALVVFIVKRNSEAMLRAVFYFTNGYDRAYLLLTIGVIFVAFVATAMNSIASTAFTREGAHLSLIKYLPVPYRTQLSAKALISILISYPPVFLTMLIVGIGFKIAPYWFLYFAVLIFAAVTITTYLGLYLDSLSPHSSWDDEYSALRGNLNTFFDMALIMVISLLCCGIGFLLDYFTHIGYFVHAYFAVMMLLGTAAAYLVLPGKIIRNMKELY